MKTDFTGSITGSAATVLAPVFGLVTYKGIEETILFAAIGAIVGFFVTKALKYAEKRVKKIKWIENLLK